jgi:hypothetical protein
MVPADRRLDALPDPPIEASDHAISHGPELIRPFRRRQPAALRSPGQNCIWNQAVVS